MQIMIALPVLFQALAISATAIPAEAVAKPDVENWNAAAWSNFVKSYVDVAETAKRDENWNAAAWSNFVKSYVDGAEDVKRDENNWNGAAWSNFVKSYVDGAEAVGK
ncbi:hypothetical protein F5X99DRAFT_374274 [Biscogniauxia marginata]|nr:hypothetical protein F5X99DRAFT_374274 [Biscogniauxia marginata]